ncbi:hypothetical protein BP5796_13130 [Coleophoma crateriformis]|uniref:AB hydrolase-1 domain-containing protein n=1 Tax=Coleophoma crateriformis TaxID=565419 RepID=A0A3D8Q3Q6_9HELO|nr:hypothetical protein BP5796_13130 [Coleophoma crateriformis]
MAAKPVLIFTPGAWHTPEIFSEVFSELEPLGFKCIGYSLLAVGHEPAVKDLQPDIDAIRQLVSDEADTGKDIVVVAHSWSGIVVSGALEGLGKVSRETEGKKGGVVRIAYISAFVPDEGVSLIQAFGGSPPEWYDVKEPWVMPKTPIPTFYHDLPAPVAESWASKLVRHSYATKTAGAKSAAWRTIPSTYLICEDDRAIPAFVQEGMVKACQDAGAPMETERTFTGHSPFLVKPDEVANFVRRAAGEGV